MVDGDRRLRCRRATIVRRVRLGEFAGAVDVDGDFNLLLFFELLQCTQHPRDGRDKTLRKHHGSVTCYHIDTSALQGVVHELWRQQHSLNGEGRVIVQRNIRLYLSAKVRNEEKWTPVSNGSCLLQQRRTYQCNHFNANKHTFAQTHKKSQRCHFFTNVHNFENSMFRFGDAVRKRDDVSTLKGEKEFIAEFANMRTPYSSS